MTKKNNRVQPFSDLTQLRDWEFGNCIECAKSPDHPPADEPLPCEIEQALLEANFGDWTVSGEIAERMGYMEGAYSWTCPEFEAGTSVDQ